MADEETTQTDDEEVTSSNNLVFSEDEIATLEKEFNEPAEDEGKETKPEDEDEEEDDDLDGIDIDNEDEDEDEETGSDDDDPEGDAGVRKEAREDEDEDEEEEDETFTLLVEGKEHHVENVDRLAALAQKGIFYEKRANESKRALENANFTMSAMIRDHFGFLEEYYTQKFGNYESARKHVAELAHAYVVPYYKELQAEPEQQRQLAENRQLKRQAKSGQQNGNGQQTEKTYTQAEIEQLQTLEHNVSVALHEVGLPKDSDPLRKRMADIMLDALSRDETMHPLTAAKHLLRERKALQKELSRTVPKGRKTGKSGKQKKADIAAAKTRRSRKKSGTGEQRGGRTVRTQRTFTGREFIDSINDALGLEP